MKGFFIFLFNLIKMLVWGGIGYSIGAVVADWYRDSLRETGGIIMAKDLLDLQLLPWSFAAIAAGIAFRIIYIKE